MPKNLADADPHGIHKSVDLCARACPRFGYIDKKDFRQILAVDDSFLIGKANPSFSPCYCDALWRLLSVKRIRRVIHGVMCA